MFYFAILTILFSYLLFFLGVAHLLSKEAILLATIMYSGALIVLVRKKLSKRFQKEILSTKLERVLVILLGILILVNFVGVLGPETSFDALWYHLTFPKLYIQEQAVRFIPGGVLYYSAMPKLGELLFVPGLAFGNEITAKAIQYIFGILTLVVIYKTARLYVSSTLALLAALIFYSNIVVAWESTVAYIDLIRGFFEILALYAFVLWHEKKKQNLLIISAFMIGGAMATKILAIISLGIFILLIILVHVKEKQSVKKILYDCLLFMGVSCLVVSPWLLFSYLSTGNPVYPFFTDIYQTHPDTTIFSLQTVLFDFLKLFLFADDPLSPIYLISLPLLIFSFKKLPFSLKLVVVYGILACIFWYITPRTGGGRFILPYLPGFSLLSVVAVSYLRKGTFVYKAFIVTVVCIAILTIGYRGIAHMRYLPVIFGQQTKQEFLTTHLNFSFGDFYDTDGYFKSHIKPTDRVLLYGVHNLYYVDFPFIDASWVQQGDMFTHIAVQHARLEDLPNRFHHWQLVYENPKTSIRLYKNGDRTWVY